MEMDDAWRGWIAENLMLGGLPEALTAALVQAGFAEPAARAEMAAALASPYLRGAQRLQNRLAKRDWVLDIQARLNRLTPQQLPRHARPTGAQFLEQYYSANRPVIITGMLDDCAARQRWSCDYFIEQLGEHTVEVQFGRDADPDYELNSLAHRRRMPLAEYARLVRDSDPTNDFYMTANNDRHNRAVLAPLLADLPPLAEYLHDGPGDRFIWLGPAGTVTPFHHDLTNNFMLQIAGRKRLLLVAPADTARMSNLRHCFSQVDGRAIDLERHPAMAGVRVTECVLEAGEIMFLPVGWWHFVEALDISITVSTTSFRWDNDFYSHYPVLREF